MLGEVYSKTGTDGRRWVWEVDKLIVLASRLSPGKIRVAAIKELDQEIWFGQYAKPTCRRISDHFVRIMRADLNRPIILSAEGDVMDGMHRVVRAFIEGNDEIVAVRFDLTPPPDRKE